MVTRKRATLLCPECGSSLWRILWGLPDPTRRRPKETLFGGCLCWGDKRDPKWGCPKCGYQEMPAGGEP